MKKKILFLGETYRADAITWMRGLKEFGGFEIITFELEHSSSGIKRIFRLFEFLLAIVKIRKLIKYEKPDLIIAERVTSYGFLAALSGFRPYIVAQQGITDIYPPKSISAPFKVLIQKFTFKNVSLIHAWGEAMTVSMLKHGANKEKILVMPKGIDLNIFTYNENKDLTKIRAIVTRSLSIDYRHHIIIKAFAKIKAIGLPFELKIVGDGILFNELKSLTSTLGLENDVIFTGRINNMDLPALLQQSNMYISMPCTEGMSASLLEAFASGCYPIVSDLPGNRTMIQNNINGKLVSVDDIKLLSEAIIDFWNKKEALFYSTIEQNRRTVEERANFSQNMATISEIYWNIIHKK
jgi:glycosyltransferase involved in cell wall biosynthesis